MKYRAQVLRAYGHAAQLLAKRPILRRRRRRLVPRRTTLFHPPPLPTAGSRLFFSRDIANLESANRLTAKTIHIFIPLPYRESPCLEYTLRRMWFLFFLSYTVRIISLDQESESRLNFQFENISERVRGSRVKYWRTLKMQPAGAPRTPGSPTRSSCHERDREREREREQERDRERERGGRQSRTSPVEDREDREERGSIARQSLGPPAAIPGSQGLSLSLEDRELWTRFQCITNEMIVTKNGRYMCTD